ncbi:DUF3298 and DUF4163 domain-containing protein [Bacillus solimangrovi]|uniref:DUF3298 domain-containing protein n=1 Tax=Bacillus solimangrovi TaxID=1305675 RepID=A0A1E5LJL4_9BACI|nr:DUF3298 and DUF4163 domain-containing protein [Bacillus solimangrovi]OEH94289.1 hypothetical protein BFG57_08505 [Bacillus solimangrovi]
MERKFEELKKEYQEIPIPDELDFVVKKALKQKTKKPIKKILISGLTAAVLLVVGGINTSPQIANAMSKVPVVGSLIDVLTIREFTIDEDERIANIEVPAVENLEDKTLENSLNSKYLEEAKQRYDEFNEEWENRQANEAQTSIVNSSYEIKADNDQILSIERVFETTLSSGSSKIEKKYDTIDKQNQILITLPLLFKDDRYIDVITENIKEQMVKQMETNPDQYSYFYEYYLDDPNYNPIAEFDLNEKFHINNDGKLVISFDEYEVGPGAMGPVEFVIPTEVLSDILVSETYIH